MHHRIAGILLSLGLMGALASQLQAQPSTSALSLPAADHTGVSLARVLDTVGNWLLLHRAYREHDTIERLNALRGVEGARAFVLEANGEITRTIEFAVAPYAGGGWEVHAFGLEHNSTETAANPDLVELERKFREVLGSQAVSAPVGKRPPADSQRPRLAPPVAGSPPIPALDGSGFSFDLDRVAFETVHLSYSQSDRVLGLLKALGYSTIEFVAQMGDVDYEAVYAPLAHGEARLPIVVKIIEAGKTSLLDPVPPPPGPPRPIAPINTRDKPAVPDIGGKLLHQATTGEALQRLLVVHDPKRPADLAKLRRLLREQIDVPSRQVVLEALVIEIDSDRMRDLGVSFDWRNGKSSASFDAAANGGTLPFTYAFERGVDFVSQFMANLHALVSRGQAEILTNPSVLVLDGRQARIQIGQQIPVVSSTATQTAVSQRVEYFPVGIVLNLRPRLDESAREVTMQVETIVSSVASTGGATATLGDTVFFAPAIENRQVQTFVRIADNTPFIIGGLIATKESEATQGVPGLSRIPGLGALFRRKTKQRVKQEVIIVLTPHIVPVDEKSFGYAVPKESSKFDSFDNELFRNAYRLRSQDIFDLSFLLRNPALLQLEEAIRRKLQVEPDLATSQPYAGILAGRVPGEDILVRRMLWEVIGADHLLRASPPGLRSGFSARHVSRSEARKDPLPCLCPA